MSRNFAILGAGNIAKKMALAVRFLAGRGEAVPYAVASRDRDKAEAFAAENGFRKAFGSYEEMLSDPDVDLVYIATPHSHHAEQMLMCIEHGKNILCEKSFTGNAAQADRVFSEAFKRNLFVAEAMWTRFIPASKKIIETIKSGEIGEPMFIEAAFNAAISHKPRIYLQELAGGAMLDLGIYPLTLAFMIFGSDVKDVATRASLTESGVDAQEAFTLVYPGGKLALLGASILADGGAPARISGTRGRIIIDRFVQCQDFKIETSDGTVRTVYAPFECNGYEYEVRAAFKSIEAGEKQCSEIPWETTLAAMRLMDRMRSEWGVRYPFD